MTRLLAVIALALCLGPAASAQTIEPREGWEVRATTKSYADLVEAVKAAAKANAMAVVTEAGPTEAAKARGITIPGNRVIGVFNNDFAVRILALSTPAMIEAPIRFYVTEGADGLGTLAWKTPGHVFAPYMAGADPSLADIAAELDAKFTAIADMAVN